MKKVFSVVFCLIVLITTLSLPAEAAYDDVSFEAEVAVLMSLNNEEGKMIFDKNADKQMAPASLTKIMTAVIVLEEMQTRGLDLETTKVPVKLSALIPLVNTDSSLSGLVEGESLSVLDLLYALLIKSGNDASNVLAEYFGNGSIPAFIEKMNVRAGELGCKTTRFMNAHGLDENGHYTSANDLIKITLHAMDFDIFEKIVSTVNYTVAPNDLVKIPREYENTNYLMDSATGYFCEGVFGVKTGYSDDAGRCVISVARRNGYEYIAVIMNAPFKDYTADGLKDNGAFIECKKMLNWAFDNIRLREVTSPKQLVATVNIENSWTTDKLDLVPKEGQKMLALSSLDASKVILVPIENTIVESMKAPVEVGQELGRAEVFYADTKIGEVTLVAAEAVRGSYVLTAYNAVVAFSKTDLFKIVLICFVLIILAFIVINVVYNRRKKSRRAPVVTNYGAGKPRTRRK